MVCKKCGLELFVKERRDDKTLALVCRNRQCEAVGREVIISLPAGESPEKE